MKIARCADGTSTFWAVIDPDAGTAAPIAGDFRDWSPKLTADFSTPLDTGEPRPLDGLRLLSPVPEGAKVIATGATYAKHVAGLGLQMPEAPAAFLKTYDSLIDPDDEIEYPEITNQLDYEAELVVVLGAAVTDRDHAIESILGYSIGNDVSARDQQFSGSINGMDMFSGKAIDRTTPIGPWIVTRDEFGDEHPDLDLSLTVDGEVRQHDRTGSMVWATGELVTYVDLRTRLHSGDAMFTGTCAGVGHEDGRYLEPGQEVVVTIERIGSLRNIVGPRPSRTRTTLQYPPRVRRRHP
jgi:2-keto-4-pentenoate hydratase/2-oxohepta-3-ene-1,7-dioic acid hydratase in catechol pathway